MQIVLINVESDNLELCVLSLAMTTFNRSTDLPASIVTLEELLAWAVLCYKDLYGPDTFQEVRNYPPEKVIDTSINTTADGVDRLIFRGTVPLDPSHASQAGKLWGKFIEHGTTPIPAAFKVD